MMRYLSSRSRMPRLAGSGTLLLVSAIAMMLNACIPHANGVTDGSPEAAVVETALQAAPEAEAELMASPVATGLVIKTSAHDVEETTARFLQVLEAKGLTVFDTIDHQENAAKADLELPATRVVIFGNAKLGTPLMQCSPTLAIDLPQKVLIWQAGEDVKLAYNEPQYLAQRHGLNDCGQDVLKKITGALDALTQKAIEPS